MQLLFKSPRHNAWLANKCVDNVGQCLQAADISAYFHGHFYFAHFEVQLYNNVDHTLTRVATLLAWGRH